MGLSIAEGRQHIAVDLFSVNGHFLHAAADMVRVFDLDLIDRPAEAAADLIAVPGMRDAGIDLQAVPVGLDAEDVVADHIEVPRGGAGQPAVLGLAEVLRVLARDHLAVDVGLHLVQVGDLLTPGGGDPAVQVKGPVAVAHHGLSRDDPGIKQLNQLLKMFIMVNLNINTHILLNI